MMKAREENHRQNEVGRISSAGRARRDCRGWKDDCEAAAQQEISVLRHHGLSGLDSLGRNLQEGVGEHKARVQCPGNDGR